MKSKVIRCGQRVRHAGISAKDVECLQNFWELQEQLGLRAKPEDTLLHRIPKVQLAVTIGEDGGNSDGQ